MSNVRDSDTSLWLHNKLGTSNDLWSDTCSIISQLNGDVLRNIRDCFVDLQSQVKLKLLLSFLHISRRNVEEWKIELEEIIMVAIEDTDNWVSMLAEMLKNYPNNGTINYQLEFNSEKFNDLVNEIRKLVRKHGDKSILPLECLYLNKNALNAQVGQLPQPIKHFTLKRKPKSATLRAELLQKSSDAASGRRSSVGSSVPIRCRGLTNDSTPLRGIPSRNSFGLTHSGFKAPPNPANKMGTNLNKTMSRMSVGGIKRGVGIKLLDITEQPIGRDSKRRKKATNEDNNEAKQKEAEKTESESATPDYAAGLTSLVPPSPAPPSYALSSTPATQQTLLSEPLQTQIPTQTTPPIIQIQHRVKPTFDTISVKNDNTVKIETVTPFTPQIAATIVQQPQLTRPQPQPQPQPQITPQPPLQQLQPQLQSQAQPQAQPQQQQQPQAQQPPLPLQQQQQPLIKRQLQLSREQMYEAQEMFKNSNKVTRPEKALILGFMAGSRENPCPQLGNVVTIKLSENEEDIQQPDGSVQKMVVETHFQMNYNTGEWKKVQKYRKIDQQLQQTMSFHGFPPHTQQTV